MAIYCMSDIHGDYERYKRMLSEIDLMDSDLLFIIGDVVDRGTGSMEILKDMMMRANVIPMIGNHEYMALNCLEFLTQEITEESIKEMDSGLMEGILQWQAVGGQATMDSFRALSQEDKEDILDYLSEFTLVEEVEAGGKSFVLAHSGLLNFDENRDLGSYDPYEVLFERPDYGRRYFKDKYIVSGHVPTRNITENPAPDRIYTSNGNIDIDCGCGYGGTLGAIRLDDLKEFYV